jgi:tRNA-dihydrouridine synthase A
MMEHTDRHCRFFLRQISARARLYTEMVTTGALLHGHASRYLAFDPAEHPLALQLGGSEPAELARCAAMAEAWGYDEVNLNCGCPSDRVQGGGFGACLMREPTLVADCVAAMRTATRLPVTVKCRIGVDAQDDPAFLAEFADAVASSGCDLLIVHARKAWLHGLSPKQNREIPPLLYERVHALAAARPDLRLVVNGGLVSLDAACAQLGALDGVMVGRAAIDDPWMLHAVDERLYGSPPPTASREAVLLRMRDYIAREQAAGTRVHAITRHMLGLYRGRPRGRAFRRLLGEATGRSDGTTLIDEAIALMRGAPQQASAPPAPLTETLPA